jgi:hypothetical protein
MASLIDRVLQEDVRDLPDWAVADILNRPDPSLPQIIEYQERLFGVGTILTILGMDVGVQVLDALESASSDSTTIRWAMVLLKGNGIDAGNPVVRQQIDSLVDKGVLSKASADALKALGEIRRFPSWAEYNGMEVTARAVGLARGGK